LIIRRGEKKGKTAVSVDGRVDMGEEKIALRGERREST